MAARRAILIASPHGGLKGCLNDVKIMEATLSAYGFVTSKCCDTAATRCGILVALNRFVEGISTDDVVVVYYSGHGGLVESPLSEKNDTKVSDMFHHWRYQFIVPIDYHQSTPADFRGILDIELSDILHRMCSKTRNITVFLDCCHAHFMARDPGLGDRAVPKSVATVRYDDILQHISDLKTSGHCRDGLYDKENTSFISIAAAAATETAWEYQNPSKEWSGAMTEALAKVLSHCKGHRLTWKASLFRISELVNVNFPNQHPCLTGPGHRYHFSLEESSSEGLYIRQEAGGIVIQAGTVSGVLKGNIYSIMNHSAKAANARDRIAEAHVIDATAFKATVSLSFCQPGIDRLPDDGATAFITHSVFPKWPVEDICGAPWLEAIIRRSKFVRLQDSTESGLALATFRRAMQKIVLHTNSGTEVIRVSVDASQKEQLQLQIAAERLARAQYLLGLKCENEAQSLYHQGRFEFGVFDNIGVQRNIRHDGTDSVPENSFTRLALKNDGPETIHVCVFNINALGEIFRISRTGGIELPPGQCERILKRKNPHMGLQITWPKGVPRTKPLEESLLFILTSAPVDLSHLSTIPTDDTPSQRTGLSKLEQLTLSIASGCYRDSKGIEDDENILRYAVYRIPFSLSPTT